METSENDPTIESIRSAGDQLAQDFQNFNPDTDIAEVGKPKVNIYAAEVLEDGTIVEINNIDDNYSNEELPVFQDRAYLASVFKPIMVIALMRLAQSNQKEIKSGLFGRSTKQNIDLIELEQLADKVIRISNDNDLAKLRDIVGGVIEPTNADSYETRGEAETASTVIENIINVWLSEYGLDENNEVLFNRSKSVSERPLEVPNSISSFETLVKSYQYFWEMLDEYPNDKLFQILDSAMSSNFDPKDWSKTHDLGNRLREHLASIDPNAKVSTKGGNATLFYNQGKLSFSEGDPNTYADVYTCVARVQVNGRDFRIAYNTVIPFKTTGNDEVVSKEIIRKELNEILDRFVANFAEAVA